MGDRGVLLNGVPRDDRGRTGAAAVSAAYAASGWDFAHLLDGAFAAVLFDPEHRLLVAAHDELGVTPLFYGESDRTLYLGTSLTELVALLGVDALDSTYLADFLEAAWHLGPRTPYLGIRRLLPGETLVVLPSGVEVRRSWHLAEVAPSPAESPIEVMEQFRDTFGNAIAQALPTAGPIWAELSGGLDSSSVFLEASRHAPGRIEALTTVYPLSANADETRWVRPVLACAQVPWHQLDGDRHSAFSSFADTFHAEPGFAVIMPGRYSHRAEMLADAGAVALLTGHGGDAVFHGDGAAPVHIADLLARGRAVAAVKEARGFAREGLVSRGTGHVLWHDGICALLRHKRRRTLCDQAGTAPWLTPRSGRELHTEAGRLHWPLQRNVADAYYMERVLRAARTLASWDPGVSCPTLHPLLTRSLVALMLSLPQRYRTHPAADRLLQRQALRHLLPDVTVRRRSKDGPDQSHLRALGRSREWQAHLTEKSELAARGYLDVERWRTAVRMASTGVVVDFRRFYATAMLEAWFKQLGRLSHVATPSLAP